MVSREDILSFCLEIDPTVTLDLLEEAERAFFHQSCNRAEKMLDWYKSQHPYLSQSALSILHRALDVVAERPADRSHLFFTGTDALVEGRTVAENFNLRACAGCHPAAEPKRELYKRAEAALNELVACGVMVEVGVREIEPVGDDPRWQKWLDATETTPGERFTMFGLHVPTVQLALKSNPADTLSQDEQARLNRVRELLNQVKPKIDKAQAEYDAERLRIWNESR